MESENYWRTQVSALADEHVSIRGFLLDDLIGGAGFTEAVFLLIRGELPTPQQARVLDAVLNSVLDYGLEKPGTVAARFSVAANRSMAAGLASACLAVGENTLATEYAGRFIRETHQEFLGSESGIEEFARTKMAQLRNEKRRIPGFGHPVFKGVDPRAQKIRSIAVEEGLWSDAAEVYEAVHRAFTALPGREMTPINDVGALAAVIDSLGFTPEEGTGLALLSTFPGLIAHISEEMAARVPIRIIPRNDVDYPDPDEIKNLANAQQALGWPPARPATASSVLPTERNVL
ncbi:citryl-CoA lyase [Brevibacterium sp.]|uniref:citryl-CoA lyase n=1 Tax=Brevibacterium sp. TaxID=1701 RepID=UPI002812597D|nr:citryl-CoA lyase [Brevibacterium sp.]